MSTRTRAEDSALQRVAQKGVEVAIEMALEADAILHMTAELDGVRRKLAQNGRFTEAQTIANIADALFMQVTQADVEELYRLEDEVWELEAELTEKSAKGQPSSQSKIHLRRQMIRLKQRHKTPVKKRWLACSRPTPRNIKGGRAWISTCQYLIMSGPHKGKKGTQTRIISHGPNKPTVIQFKKPGSDTYQRVKII